MTPDQLRAELARLDLSQVGLARHLEIDPRTIRRYCAGDLDIPGWMPLALKGLGVEMRRKTPGRGK